MTTDIAMAVGCFNIQVEPKSSQRNCIIYRTWFNYRSYPPLLLASLPPPPKEMDHSTSQESKGIWVAFGFELLGTDSLIIIHTDTSCFSRRYIKLPWWVAAKGKRKNIEKGSDSDQTGLGPGAAWGVHTVKGCSSLSYFQLCGTCCVTCASLRNNAPSFMSHHVMLASQLAQFRNFSMRIFSQNRFIH